MAIRAVQTRPGRFTELDESVYKVLCKALGVGNRNPKAMHIITDHVLNMPLVVLEKVDQVARSDQRMLVAVASFMIDAYRAKGEGPDCPRRAQSASS